MILRDWDKINQRQELYESLPSRRRISEKQDLKYQVEAVNEILSMLDKNLNPVVDMDTGLGKTFITINVIIKLIIKLEEQRGDLLRPILILTRASNIIDPWKAELSSPDEDLPAIPCYIYHGSKRNNIKCLHNGMLDLDRYYVIVTSYTAFKNYDKINEYFFNTVFSMIVYDEFHTLINGKKPVALLNTISTLKSDHRLILTASPLNNTMQELFVLCKFAKGESCYEIYEALACKKDKDKDKDKKIKQEIEKVIEENFYIKSKKDVADEDPLPEIQEYLFILPISDKMKEKLGEMRKNQYPKKISFLAMPNNTFLTSDVSELNKDIKFNSKEKVLRKIIDRIPNDQKVIVFSMYKSITASFASLFSNLEYFCIIVDGSHSLDARLGKINKFKSIQGKALLFTTLKSSGLGLNLQIANHVIFLDEWFNPQIIKQARDRSFRKGQKRKTYVYHLSTNTDVENKVREIMSDKNELSETFFHYNSLPIDTYDFSDDPEYLTKIDDILKRGLNTNSE